MIDAATEARAAAVLEHLQQLGLAPEPAKHDIG